MSIHEVIFDRGEVIQSKCIDEEINNAIETGEPYPTISFSKVIYHGKGIPNEIPTREVVLLKAESKETVAFEKHIKGADVLDGSTADILISRTVFKGEDINGKKVLGFGKINELKLGNRGYVWTPTKT